MTNPNDTTAVENDDGIKISYPAEPLMGWMCPGCGQCYSPFVQKCWGCGPITITTSGDIPYYIGPTKTAGD